MSVIVKVIGENDGTDEYLAAESLSRIINDTVPQSAMGEIVLFPSATLFGQAVKDVDIMMIGSLKNYSAIVRIENNGVYSSERVYLENFCTTIEVKSHSISGVRKEGTNIQVFYSDSGWHNATKQSNDQKTSAMRFFKNALGESPYITNLLWFTEVSETELKRLLSFNGNEMPSNTLPDVFDFGEVVQKLAYQRVPRKYGANYSINCSFNGRDTDSITKPLFFFSRVKNGMGELTRRRIELITNTELMEKEPSFDGNTFNLFRGRAGTGKTIDLIRIAIKLVDEEGARVQLLTYNRALVSDIRRLFSLAELPDMFEEKCVSVNTMQSFFYGLINSSLFDGTLSGEEFLSKYQILLLEMIDFLKSDPEARDIIKTICEDNPKLNWDYILIDEAQDWSSEERDLILLLYDKNKLIVADGGQQFVRDIEPCDWTIVPKRSYIKLKYCLRQKRNLVNFINRYTEEMEHYGSKMIASEKLLGGKIIILLNKEEFYRTIKTERNELKRYGNTPYDMIFLVPSTLVEEKDKHRHFKLLKEFEHKDLLLWDGTNEDNRIEFSVNLEESRVLQYESARGLEGWTVCCMNFDEFMEIKEKQYSPKSGGNKLFLENDEDKKRKYIINWALIPFTRAIDTLIITLHDTNSLYSKQLIKLAKQHPDYIRVI